MRKGVITAETLVIIIAILIGAVVLLFSAGAFGKLLTRSAEKSTCQWSLFLHSITTSSLGISGIPPECKMKKRTITWDELSRGTQEAAEQIRGFAEKEDLYTPYAKPFIDAYKKSPGFKSTNILYEYALDRIIATEMKSCTDKVLNYKFPLFDQWWKLWKWDHTPPDNTLDAMLQWIPEYRHAPVFCVVCSRIKFDDKTRQELDRPIDTLDDFMVSNPVPLDQKNRNYLDYITDPAASDFFTPSYQYTTQNPLAVVYARVNTLKAFSWAATAVNVLTPGQPIKPEDIASLNTMNLVPFGQVSNICDFALS